MIRKVGARKWAVVHCHGKNKGKAIKTFSSRKKASEMHRAIQASKARSKKR